MDFFSKFKKTDQTNPTSDDQEPDSSSYATETTAATDTYSSGDVTKGSDTTEDYSDKPSGGGEAVGTYASNENEKPGSYGDDTTEDYSDKPSGGGDAVGTYASDAYDQSGGGYGEDTEEGYSKKPQYGGTSTGTDGYEQPEGGYGVDTEEGFSKKQSYGGSTEGEYGEEAAEDLSGKPLGTATDDYGKYTSTEDFSYIPSVDDAATGADSGEGYASESYKKNPSGGYGATTGDYASDEKYNE